LPEQTRDRTGTERERWQSRYESGDLPWDTGVPDPHLVRLVRRWPVPRGRLLEVGCGTGTNLVWLAGQGFVVTGIDLAPQAVEAARVKIRRAGVESTLFCGDFLTAECLEKGGYHLVFDRGCFHAMREADRRRCFVQRVADLLARDGLWFSLMGNADDPCPEGPPRLRAGDIALALEPDFEILLLESVDMTDSRGRGLRFWQCLARARRERGKNPAPR